MGKYIKKGKQSDKYTSKQTGVFYNSVLKKWLAFVKVNGKRKQIGTFDCEEDAILRVHLAEDGLFVISRRSGQYSSKYAGVHWHESRRRWVARAWINGKYHYIGLFTTEEAAKAARDAVCN